MVGAYFTGKKDPGTSCWALCFGPHAPTKEARLKQSWVVINCLVFLHGCFVFTQGSIVCLSLPGFVSACKGVRSEMPFSGFKV